jgi:hypothetical protein
LKFINCTATENSFVRIKRLIAFTISNLFPACRFVEPGLARLILHRLGRAAAINWNHVVGKTVAG